MKLTPRSEVEARIDRLRGELAALGLDAALIVQRADLFYLSGTGQQGYLFVPKEGDPLLLIKKSLLRASTESPLSQVLPLRNPSELPGLLKECGHGGIKRLGMELDVVPTAQYFRYQKIFGQVQIEDVSPAIRRLRMVKSPYEISLMREAALVAEKVYKAALANLRPEMTEVELAAALEHQARLNGHQGYVRVRAFNQELGFGNILAGAGASVPSYFDGATGGSGLNPSMPIGAGAKPIWRGEPVILDTTVVIEGYIVDQTRVVSLGSPAAHLREAHDVALRIQRKIAVEARPGVGCEDLYLLALEEANSAGLKDNFMGYGPDQAGFVGHGVGLELDEWPVLARGFKQPLVAGMTLAVEPKFVFPGEGAVGIEDTFLVTDQGLEAISLPPLEIATIG